MSKKIEMFEIRVYVENQEEFIEDMNEYLANGNFGYYVVVDEAPIQPVVIEVEDE